MVELIYTDLAESVGLPTNRFPRNAEEAAIAEAALAGDFANLNVDDHDKVLFDLSGISEHDSSEDPLILEEKLNELEREIQSMHDKHAYTVAEYLNKPFVHDRSFRLMFLRAARFDVKIAAQQMVAHFDAKRKLFNDQILTRHVKLSDLSLDDLECLRMGNLQFSPHPDISGRPVLFACATHKQPELFENMLRVFWFLIMTALQDEAVQQSGIVFVLYNYGTTHGEFDNMKRFLHVRVGIPLKPIGTHFCYNHSSLRPVVTGFQLFLRGKYRIRMRPHFLEPKEAEQCLQTQYGLPVGPMSANGVWDTSNHQEWLQRLWLKEDVTPTKAADAIVPHKFDCLFGKSKRARDHTGTIRCRVLVEMQVARYEKASRRDKTKVADDVIAIVHASKGRFLKCVRNQWVEVPHEMAREKLSHFFRELRATRRMKAESADKATSELSVAC